MAILKKLWRNFWCTITFKNNTAKRSKFPQEVVRIYSSVRNSRHMKLALLFFLPSRQRRSGLKIVLIIFGRGIFTIGKCGAKFKILKCSKQTRRAALSPLLCARFTPNGKNKAGNSKSEGLQLTIALHIFSWKLVYLSSSKLYLGV
jgi:hypothetical protein